MFSRSLYVGSRTVYSGAEEAEEEGRGEDGGWSSLTLLRVRTIVAFVREVEAKRYVVGNRGQDRSRVG